MIPAIGDLVLITRRGKYYRCVAAVVFATPNTCDLHVLPKSNLIEGIRNSGFRMLTDSERMQWIEFGYRARYSYDTFTQK